MTNQVFVSLGSNINKERNLPAAVRLLAHHCHILAISRVYQTKPVSLKPQPAFFNAAVLVETALSASEFREQVLAKVERVLERLRTADKNAPRTIDADITLFNNEVLHMDPEHPIPDPELLKRSHVAVPIADLDPWRLHPVTGERLAEIAERLLAEERRLGLHSIWPREDVDLGSTN
jgi:2-amino-4-hydroxy-6-hydroxymethyldihydropteridine diphosphokinase